MKKLANKKIILGITSMLVCIGLIAICSFVPFIVDPSRWQTKEFLTDELITVAIVISSMVSMIMVGQASNAMSEQSNVAKARVKFFESVKLVTNLNAFSQWVREVLQKKDIETIKERKARDLGIEDMTILSLDVSEIKSLQESPQKINGRYYKSLTKEQVNGLIKIKTKKINVQLVEPEYYLSVKNLIDSRTITERSSKEGTKKGLYLTQSIVGKLVITVVVAMIFASLMMDVSESVDVASSMQKFVSRLWSMLTSAFMGYIVGCQINDIDAEYIEMRVTVHNMFSQDKTFKPRDQQEDAKKQYEEANANEDNGVHRQAS